MNVSDQASGEKMDRESFLVIKRDNAWRLRCHAQNVPAVEIL